jgi:ABC-2 type transport system permease protein
MSSHDRVSAEAGEARIFDRGYRRYDGERKSASGAVYTLYLATLQRVLGIRRGAKAKILPILVIAISFLPAVAFVGIAALFPKELHSNLPGYERYYGYIIAAILLFASFVTPEALCPDRRYKILGIYLASPLNRFTYVLAKFGAVVTVLSIVTIGPPLLLLIARSLLDTGPAGKDFPLVFGRIVFSGIVMALFYASLSLAISSLTSRKGFASAGIVLTSLMSQVIGGILGDNPSGLLLRRPAIISIVTGPFDLVQRIFNKPTITEASTGLVASVIFGTILVSLTVLVLGYRRLEVTR